ncbi:MAG: Uma2 family endonuclease [Chloroflexota bacterium]|nr:Uma2 family endonuclease [Chloroflexota bacterium]MDE2958943.1 Uma2 family endonuclease [Chloroflexota bacterium]
MVAKPTTEIPAIFLENVWVDGDPAPSPIHLDFRPLLKILADVGITGAKLDEWLLDLNEANRELVGKLELTSEGALLISPMQSKRGSREEAEFIIDLGVWTRAHGGEAHGARLGVHFPNGARYAPDAAWLSPEQLAAYTPSEETWLLDFCPYFVVEIMSRTDSQASAHRKMRDYIDHGATLGWLIDPFRRSVHIYRPGVDVVVLDDPETVSGEPDLPGFIFNVRSRIFDAA